MTVGSADMPGRHMPLPVWTGAGSPA